MKTSSIWNQSPLKYLIMVCFVLAMAACGGGNGGPGVPLGPGNGGGANNGTIQISFENSNGNPIGEPASIPADSFVFVVAHVTNNAGDVVVGAPVTFSLNNPQGFTLAVLSGSASALTDADGNASIKLTAVVTSPPQVGAGSVTASASITNPTTGTPATITASAGFCVGAGDISCPS